MSVFEVKPSVGMSLKRSDWSMKMAVFWDGGAWGVLVV
jgi:hypothetical protein